MRTRPNAHGAGLETASFAGQRVLVLGLGRFDGGVATTRFLRAEGASVLVSDTGSPASLATSLAAIRAVGAEERLGPQTPALLEGCDAVIANPAIPFEHPVLEAADARGIPVTTEINIVLARTAAPVVGVTGTKGKSTTTTLIAHMLEAGGARVHRGGNIGHALVARLDDIAADHVVVLELSSFQLWWTRRIQRSPQVAVVTNLLSDHLDRHGDHGHYAEAKRAILDYQGPDDGAVLPADDPGVDAAGWANAGQAKRLAHGVGGDVACSGSHVIGPGGEASLLPLQLVGPHNRSNVAAAAAGCLAWLATPRGGQTLAGSAWPAIAGGIATMEPLPHRLQPVATVDGVRYVDDSNATHPDAARAALVSFEAPLIVLAGGKDKGSDLSAFAAALGSRAKALVALGTTGPALAAAVEGARRSPAEIAFAVRIPGPTMAEAVAAARALAEPGDVVLLSPGCSSLDQYASFAARGKAFHDAVQAIAERSRARP